MQEQPKKKRIGELLIENGYISPEQLEEALHVQKKKRDRIGNILIDLGYLSESSFLDFLSKTSDTPSIELSSCEIEREILELVPLELARRLEAIPIGKIGKLLTVAMVCPLDEAGLKELENTTGLNVRPVLCSRSAVFGTIDAYYGMPEGADTDFGKEEDLSVLEGSLKLCRVAKLVKEIEELPTLPEILNVISSIANDPSSSSADMAKVIASDSSLSAKILKLANSAAFGFSRKISNIQHAVTLLGFRETQELALSATVLDHMGDKADLDYRAYWNHSFMCATLARLISLSLKSPEAEGAFVAGLLHDVGKVVLAMKMPGKLKRVAALCSDGTMPRLQAEEKILGLTHAEVGYLLSERWLLPDALTNAIRYHHSPGLEAESTALTGIIFLANVFSKTADSEAGPNGDFSDDVQDILKKLGVSETVFRQTLEVYSDLASDITLF